LYYSRYMSEGEQNENYADIYDKYINENNIIATTFESFREFNVVPFFASARLLPEFSLLYYPKNVLTNIETDKFVKAYNYAQTYYNNSLYNDAYKYNNPKYHSLCKVIIIFMAIERYLNARLEDIDNIDFFDEYSIRNLFLSYGLDYFFDMPLKYQKRILKNINFLIKNKGTNKALINVLSIFGFSNIKIMKYFLCKDYKDDVNGHAIINDPNLVFYGMDVSVEHIEEGLKDKHTKRYDYEQFISSDKYWQLDESETNQVLEEPFNYIYSKYISIDSFTNLFDIGIRFSWLINYLYSLYLLPRWYTALKRAR